MLDVLSSVQEKQNRDMSTWGGCYRDQQLSIIRYKQQIHEEFFYTDCSVSMNSTAKFTIYSVSGLYRLQAHSAGSFSQHDDVIAEGSLSVWHEPGIEGVNNATQDNFTHIRNNDPILAVG